MINLKSQREIALMREAGAIVGNLLNLFNSMVKPGVTTIELDKFAENFIIKHNAKPAFKGFVSAFKQHYPYTLCTSVNESVVHEMPSKRVLQEGDIISIDVGTYYKGYYGDGAYTFTVGEVNKSKLKLIEVTKHSLELALKKAYPGNHLTDISNTVQTYVESNGFSIVRDFTGHGIGTQLHEEPTIFNFGKPSHGPVLEPGMTLAIEPMVNAGTYEVKVMNDGWRAVTLDGKPSAHFEHTIVITEGEPKILTLPVY
ncbi:MAG: type I methionyl aminopeptidase [bacterium]|nr:type I methionyl aminopeptidase [bacterium]